jgi:LysM repeat protein
MSLRFECARAAGLLAGLVLLTGCPPPSGGSADNNPLIQEAVGLTRTDPVRAIELLEQALGGNPGLARAHRELGNLHYAATHDYAAAVYHFRKFLELDAESQWRRTIEDQIQQSKIELARQELETLSDSAALRRIQSLMSKNAELLKELEEANGKRQHLEAQLRSLTNQMAGVTQPESGNPIAGRQPPPAESERTVSPAAATAIATTPATHQVVSGDTLSSIGRAHGFSLANMKAANPGINHDRLRIGQTINLPRRTGTR